MKKIQILLSLFLVLIAAGCSKDGIDDDLSFLSSASSTNVTKVFEISNDNSGIVKITPSGQGVSSYTILFGDSNGGVSSQTISPGQTAIHAYPEGSYTVSIIAYDIAGDSSITTYPLSLTYRVPENLQISVSGDSRISATALYANSFTVFYGDVPNETGTPLAVGATLPAHIYPAGGPYDLRVVANSGGAATTSLTRTMFGLPLTFESPTMNYFFGTFGGVIFSTVNNPAPGGLNTSAKVGKYEKPNGAETWSGTYSPMDIPINMAYGRKLKMLVYNPSVANVGKKINVELEWGVAGTGAPDNGVAVLKVPIVSSGAWEELVFDFATIPQVAATARFTQLVLRFNDSSPGAGEIFYIDNIRLTN
jgi:hypothetical protein